MTERQAISWVVAEPEALKREKAEMERWAPALQWREDLIWRQGRRAYGWVGLAPEWAADRPKPPGVEELIDGRALQLEVVYPEAFPAAPPELFPIEPSVPLDRRTLGRWHINGDGSLCLMQRADDWQIDDTAAALVRKASGWFIEYLLLEGGAIEKMTESGIFSDTDLDPILTTFAK